MTQKRWLYKYLSLWEHVELQRKLDAGGYLVYRHVFDLSRCTLEAGAEAHRQALFVMEGDAKLYCQWRNAMADKFGSDATDGVVLREQPSGVLCFQSN